MQTMTPVDRLPSSQLTIRKCLAGPPTTRPAKVKPSLAGRLRVAQRFLVAAHQLHNLPLLPL